MRSLTHGTERGGRALRVTALLTLVIGAFVLPASASAVAPGGLDQLPGAQGCHTSSGSAGACGTIHDFSRSFDAQVSTDGKNVYATGLDTNSILVFDRNPSTGALTQKGGDLGCVKSGAPTASCRGANGPTGPVGLALPPNGRTLYVADYYGNRVLTFDRDPGSGALTQRAGTEGCIADTATALCRDGRALQNPSFLTVTPDGKYLYVGSELSDSVTALAIDGNGVLTGVTDGSGGSGCVENTPTAGNDCADGRALDGPFGINADSSSSTIYVATFAGQSISALGRDPATGRLSQLPGPTGCVAQAAIDSCTVLPELSSLRDVVGAPGGQHIYVPVENQNRVLLFDRQESGGIVRRAGPSGCVSNGPAADCTTGRGLSGPAGVAVSPDGDDVYVSSQDPGGGLVELDRASNGVLTPRGDTRGCATFAAVANCSTLRGVDAPYDVKVSPDGRNVYITDAFGTPALGVFRRDSQGAACTDAAQTVTQGTLTSLKLPCSDVDGDPVSFTAPISPPTIGTLGAVDQSAGTIPYAASQGQCGTTSFTFNGSSSGQTSATRTFTLSVVGCSTGGGGGPTAPTLIPSTVSNNWAAARTYTTVISLSAKRLPAGAKVVVNCKTKSKRLQKRRCPYKSKSFKAPAGKNQVNLAKLFRKKKLPIGTKITVTITAPGFIGKKFVYTTRRRAIPKLKLTCLTPGSSTKTVSCG